MNVENLPTPSERAESITSTKLKRKIDAGQSVTILDARSPQDVEKWQIEGENVELVNVPYHEFIGEALDETLLSRVPTGSPLVVVCAKGQSSRYVAGELVAAGRDAVQLTGGMNEWARIYERRVVTAYDGPGTAYQYQRPSSGCLGYLLVAGGQAAVIDPLRAFTDRYLADAESLDAELRYAFDTHVHADHVSGVRALHETGVTGVIPAAAVSRGITYAESLETTTDGETFDVGTATIETIATPGHTSGMTSYLLGESLLATGDGLFVETVARPDLEENAENAPDAARQLYQSVQQRVLTLDDDVLVGGGHVSDSADPAPDNTYTAPIGELADDIKPLSADETTFVETVLADMPPRPANYERIIATNLGQQSVTDQRAFELELGPNNCAASRDAMTGE